MTLYGNNTQLRDIEIRKHTPLYEEFKKLRDLALARRAKAEEYTAAYGGVQLSRCAKAAAMRARADRPVHADYTITLDDEPTNYPNTPTPKERPMLDPNDVIAIVDSSNGNATSYYRREVEEEETIEAFENRVQRAAARIAANRASDVYILRAVQSVSVPVNVNNLVTNEEI